MKTLLLACLLSGHVAWASASAVKPADIPNPDALLVLLQKPWITLDPAYDNDHGGAMIVGNVYESLLAFGSGPEDIRPWLSREVPTVANGLASADGRKFSFPIRSGVRFHDGTELTPEDVHYSILRELVSQNSNGRMIRARDEVGRWRLKAGSLEKAFRVEGDKVVFEFKEPFPGLFKLLASMPIIVSKPWTIAHGGWDGVLPSRNSLPPKPTPYLQTHANGTGPFQLVSVDTGSVTATLGRFEGYWREPAKLERVVLHSEPSEAMRVLMLDGGQADLAQLSRPALGLVDLSRGISIHEGAHSFNSGETFFLTRKISSRKNTRLGSGTLDGAGIPPDFFADESVRRAFAYAFDEQAYLRSALGGKGIRAVGPLPGRRTSETEPAHAINHDPLKAEEFFRKAYGGKLWEKGFELTLSYPQGSLQRHLACDLLKAGVERLNPKFKVNLEVLPLDRFIQEMFKHRFPIFIVGIYTYPDPFPMAFEYLHSKGGLAGAQNFSDSILDGLIESVKREANPEAATAIYQRITERALELSPQIYTYHETDFKATRSWLKGLEEEQTVNGLAFKNLVYFHPLYKSSTAK